MKNKIRTQTRKKAEENKDTYTTSVIQNFKNKYKDIEVLKKSGYLYETNK